MKKFTAQYNTEKMNGVQYSFESENLESAIEFCKQKFTAAAFNTIIIYEHQGNDWDGVMEAVWFGVKKYAKPEQNDIFVYADENNLAVVRTTDNERALVDFEDFEAAKRAADEVGGIVSLICNRDGERLWSNQGWTDKPIEFDDTFIDCEQHLYIYGSEEEFLEYSLAVFDEKIEEKCELDELAELAAKGRDTYDALCSMDEDEVLIYYPYDHSYDIRKRYDTLVRYDSKTYAIAVVVKAKDEE